MKVGSEVHWEGCIGFSGERVSRILELGMSKMNLGTIKRSLRQDLVNITQNNLYSSIVVINIK